MRGANFGLTGDCCASAVAAARETAPEDPRTFHQVTLTAGNQEVFCSFCAN
jgi:hypothetical protein